MILLPNGTRDNTCNKITVKFYESKVPYNKTNNHQFKTSNMEKSYKMKE